MTHRVYGKGHESEIKFLPPQRSLPLVFLSVILSIRKSWSVIISLIPLGIQYSGSVDPILTLLSSSGIGQTWPMMIPMSSMQWAIQILNKSAAICLVLGISSNWYLERKHRTGASLHTTATCHRLYPRQHQFKKKKKKKERFFTWQI